MTADAEHKRTIGYWSVVSIGIGGMVGGGIFAVLGLAVQLAHGGTPIAFILAGLIALITSYSYAKLSVKFPSRGGTVEFLNQAFGTGLTTGGLNILLWVSYAIMLSLYAFAFGSYGASFFAPAIQPIAKHILISAIVILLAGLNVLGAKAVGESEKFVVAIKVAILLFFVAVGLQSVNPSNLAPSRWANPFQLIAGGMIIFLAYEGFELIANTAEDVKNPAKNLPRAYYTAVLFVILLYALVSIVTVGNLSVGKIVAARDYALAEAARPFLGAFGFALIAIAALLSTASAINATLYGASRISYIIAKNGELPEMLERKIWNNPVEGLLITAAVTLFVANTFDLSSISVMGSAGFLIIFAMVNAANVVLHKETKSKSWLSGFGVLASTSALAILLWQETLRSVSNIFILIFIVAMSFVAEAVYRRFTGRTILPLIRV